MDVFRRRQTTYPLRIVVLSTPGTKIKMEEVHDRADNVEHESYDLREEGRPMAFTFPSLPRACFVFCPLVQSYFAVIRLLRCRQTHSRCRPAPAPLLSRTTPSPPFQVRSVHTVYLQVIVGGPNFYCQKRQVSLSSTHDTTHHPHHRGGARLAQTTVA